MAIELTPEEEQARIDFVRILVGDSEGSIFYPMYSDEQYRTVLEYNNWDVMKSARMIGRSLAMLFSMTNVRERTGDIEVWNSAAMEYRKALNDFLDDTGAATLPDSLIPYTAGISQADICKYFTDPDIVRSPLAQISPCVAWWTRLDRQGCCDDNDFGLVFKV